MNQLHDADFPEEVRFTLLQAEFYAINLPAGLALLREPWRDALFYDFGLAAKTSSEL